MSLPTTGASSSSVSLLTTRNPNTPELLILQSQERQRIGIMNSSIIPEILLFIEKKKIFLVKFGVEAVRANGQVEVSVPLAVTRQIIDLLIKATHHVFFNKDYKDSNTIKMSEAILQIVLKIMDLIPEKWRYPIDQSVIESIIQEKFTGREINSGTVLSLLHMKTARSLNDISGARGAVVLFYEEIAQKESMLHDSAIEECGIEVNRIILDVMNEIAYLDTAEHFKHLKRIAETESQNPIPKKKKRAFQHSEEDIKREEHFQTLHPFN